MKLTISTAPHIMSSNSVSSIMKDVVIALVPAIVGAFIFFGVDALRVIVASVLSCLIFEYLASKFLLKSKNSIKDYSAVITGLLLAFNLPSNIPTAMVVIGAFVAIMVGKMAFGGLGKNVFNPALVGRVFLFISFPLAMSTWPEPLPFEFFNVDGQTKATTLAILKNSDNIAELPSKMDLFFGNRGGCLGETSVLALLLGFLYMLYKRVVCWHIPVFYVGSVFVYCTVAYLVSGDVMYNPLVQIMAGGLMIGAIFMATDYVSSPMSKKGQIIYAIGCGLLTCVIRFYGSYPEGVSFAILIMNAVVPIIDKYTHARAFGAKR